VAATARATGLSETDVARFFNLFRKTPNVVTCYSQGVNQSAQGTDKVGAIINCHLATGRIGRPGMGPFSLTGQPNAMGGREVGGLANQLAAHMGFTPTEIERVGRFWNAPRMAQREGHKAVQMFEAIARGEIKALWVMATNPAVSLPQAKAVREALRGLELLVISENVRSNDSVNCGAHVLLPAAAWGEKDGTVTNSERRISRQRPFLPLPGDAQPDWWIVTEVARRMGFSDGFGYRSAADIFREHAALSAFENGGTRDFDIGALAAVSDAEFDALEPVQWPARAGTPNSETRLFAAGGFFTGDRRARLVAPEPPHRGPRCRRHSRFI
jgi:assimilatory nitrate reductase catalytic subunit